MFESVPQTKYGKYHAKLQLNKSWKLRFTLIQLWLVCLIKTPTNRCPSPTTAGPQCSPETEYEEAERIRSKMCSSPILAMSCSSEVMRGWATSRVGGWWPTGRLLPWAGPGRGLAPVAGPRTVLRGPEAGQRGIMEPASSVPSPLPSAACADLVPRGWSKY